MAASGAMSNGWWWPLLLLAGCVQGGIPVGGGFGQQRQQPFAQPVEEHPDRLDLATGASAGTSPDAAAPQATVSQEAGTDSRGESVSVHDAAMTKAPAAAEPATAEPTTAEPMPPSAPVDDRQRERMLRNAYAAAGDPTDPALRLAGFLTELERHDEALFVIDGALERQRSATLQLARARLLRDLYQLRAAAEQLREVQREQGPAKVAPSTLFELAQVEWNLGQPDSAADTMRLLRQRFADSRWLKDNAEQVDIWDRRVQAKAPPTESAEDDIRDLFAILRAHPQVSRRLALLEQVARPPADITDDPRRPLRVQVIAIACADRSTSVRVRAVQLAALNRLDNRAFWSAALRDEQALVRRFAALGAARQYGREIADELLQALEREEDRTAFGAFHKALQAVFDGERVTADLGTELGRRKVIAHWRERCQG